MFDEFIPKQAWSEGSNKNCTHKPQKAHRACNVHLNRLLDDIEVTTHQPLSVAHACRLQHVAHTSEEVTEKYKTANKHLRLQIERAQLVHNHLYTQLLYYVQKIPNVHNISLRELCVAKQREIKRSIEENLKSV